MAIASVCCNFDAYQSAERHSDFNSTPCRVWGLNDACVDTIHCVEVLHVRQVDSRSHDIGGRKTQLAQDFANDFESSTRLSRYVAFDDATRCEVSRRLARNEHEVAGYDGV
jgi:hypothetical protein